MMTIPGYTLTDPVCETGDLILYQATRVLDGLPVLLKVPAAPSPTSAILRRLELEYELASDLDPDLIARPVTDFMFEEDAPDHQRKSASSRKNSNNGLPSAPLNWKR